jgi:RHS repeat-associated protein
VTYAYDPFGRRIAKSVGGKVTQYLYDGPQILAEYAGDGAAVARYTYGQGIDAPLIMERDINSSGAFEPDEASFYVRDGLGSVRALTNSAGQVMERYQFDSFGNLIQAGTAGTASALGNPFLFTGREWDSEIGLYYYRARHYDPANGRFLQADSYWVPTAAESLNRYAYARNNPINMVDPSGHSPQRGDLSSTLDQLFYQIDHISETNAFEMLLHALDATASATQSALTDLAGAASKLATEQATALSALMQQINELKAVVNQVPPTAAQAQAAIQDPQASDYNAWIQQAAAPYWKLARQGPIYIGIRNIRDTEGYTQTVDPPQVVTKDTEPVARKRPDGSVELIYGSYPVQPAPNQ